MSHWIVLPVVLPAMLAAAMTLLARYHAGVERALSLAGLTAFLALALGLAWQAGDGTVTIYQLGAWQAPFGIVLVADRLSTYMVLLLAILSLLVMLHAIGSGWDKRGRHFHPLFQFQIMGIAGAFLTGDIFNLFVFFEVLLIASYGLLVHSGGAKRVRAGTQYVLYNLLGSTLFLFALGTLYAETGTLNMADLAGRVAMIDPGASASIRVAAVLLLLVFAVKAALLPLHFWLPAAYSQAPGPVAALFAIMTKVGAYAIIRIYTLVFPPDLEVTAGLHEVWLLPLALISLAIGMIGVLAARSLDRLVAFAVVGSMGMVMTAIGLMSEAGLTAALYYVAHSTFATAALFLLVDIVGQRRGAGARIEGGAPMVGGPLLGGLFFASAIAMAGLPPLSGFLGKLLILDAAYDSTLIAWIWTVVLGSSLVAVVGFARAGSTVFWKPQQVAKGMDDLEAEQHISEADRDSRGKSAPALPVVAVGGFVALLAAQTIFAGPMTDYMRATVDQLMRPGAYVSTVLDTPGKEISYGHYEDEAGYDESGSSEEGGH
ncbi:multisubunit potassium/proton antiporter, PhaD subunit (TC 2.A.63.1.1) [Palleronia marisminoris]|uniref:Na(+)/H(+) antiporter subunit D n=1 Tax=Palleronia marisminoris TaxID=315423 RepID=A0A1Y5SYR2_9RHOB|nr:monovalent cation/H+ antiporter subunit D [Palleronia marisminoris]SFH07937.1 multisubunit potassium/proton antiporter, PhaD subunit (TC 2.A.63.1.1) [Palleronia marisminoris]SLN52031.1 Na(+)/H(+) antiporter subunit D [Palleronia marisminoris]